MELETCIEKMKQLVMIRLTQEISVLAYIFLRIFFTSLCSENTKQNKILLQRLGNSSASSIILISFKEKVLK